MKQTKNKNSKNKDIITIGDEWTGADRPSFICNYCNRTLSRLTDSSGQNHSYYCNNCSIEFNPESENVRRESKISVPDRNAEPCVTSIQTNMEDDIRIRKLLELKDGALALSKRGTIKFTHYEDSSQR
jgi:uncharacterized Zn ribbon protein